MPGGTWISWRGIPGVSAVLRNARGYASPVSEVVLPLAALFELEAPTPGRLGQAPPEPAELNLAPIQGDAEQPAVAAALERLVGLEGRLVLAEVGGLGDTYQVTRNLWVKQAFLVTRDADLGDPDAPALVKLALVDERYLWRGVLPKWSFNRPRADGTFAADSVKEGGEAYSREEILRDFVAPELFRAPAVERVPERWKLDKGAIEFAPFEEAVPALAELVKKGGAEAPSLHLDGKLAIYRRGEGKVGYAQDGKGPNVLDLPLSHVGADGLGRVVEPSYPVDYLVVVGEPAIATVSLDDWEPVLVVRGRPYLLSNELVARLTGGKFEREDEPDSSLAWLKRWVNLPAADQGALDLGQPTLPPLPGTEDPIKLTPTEVIEILAGQAWRVYRLPGAEEIVEGWYSGAPGKNAHLLPLLARAETAGGRRLPISVETYSFALVRKDLATGTVEAEALARIQKREQEIRDLIGRRASRQGVGNPLGARLRAAEGGFGDRFRDVQYLPVGEFLELDSGAVDRQELAHMLETARRVREIEKALGSDLAAQYKAALDERFKVQDDLRRDGEGRPAPGVRSLHWELAQELAEIEQNALELRGFGEDLDEAIEPFREQIKNRIDEKRRAIRLKIQETIRQNLAGVSPGRRINAAIALVNNARAEDGGASVLSAEQGLIRTSGLAGWAATPGVPTPALTDFLPRAVRVLLGATLRPRTNPPGRPLTGDDAQALAQGGGLNYVPEVLGDTETFLLGAYKRTANGAEPVDFASIPKGQAVRLYRPWRRLIPIEGEGNRGQIERDALALANAAMGVAELVEGEELELGRPWPVQPDGIVQSVEVSSQTANGAPCGFLTKIVIGSGQPDPEDARTRERGKRSPGGLLDHLKREGIDA